MSSLEVKNKIVQDSSTYALKLTDYTLLDASDISHTALDLHKNLYTLHHRKVNSTPTL